MVDGCLILTQIPCYVNQNAAVRILCVWGADECCSVGDKVRNAVGPVRGGSNAEEGVGTEQESFMMYLG